MYASSFDMKGHFIVQEYSSIELSNFSLPSPIHPSNFILPKQDLAIIETNVAYTQSGVSAQLNLVHAAYTTYTEASSDAFGTALGQLRSQTDGIMNEAHTLREEYGADLVALIIDDSQYCGIAYLGPRTDLMFSVTGWNCATGYYSFGHGEFRCI